MTGGVQSTRTTELEMFDPDADVRRGKKNVDVFKSRTNAVHMTLISCLCVENTP